MRGWAGCLAVWVFASGACVKAPAQPQTVRAGDGQGPPRVEALPSLDVVDGDLTRQMRAARRLSEESLNLKPPQPPESRAASQISAWSEQTLGPFLEAKQSSAQAARAELDLAAGESERQRIVAGALVGLVYEDLVSVLLSVPSPEELDSEPEIKALHREVIFKQAIPYLRHAKLAYDACAANAKQQASLAHWASFCSARASGLPPLEEQAQENGATTVEVSRED